MGCGTVQIRSLLFRFQCWGGVFPSYCERGDRHEYRCCFLTRPLVSPWRLLCFRLVGFSPGQLCASHCFLVKSYGQALVVPSTDVSALVIQNLPLDQQSQRPSCHCRPTAITVQLVLLWLALVVFRSETSSKHP